MFQRFTLDLLSAPIFVLGEKKQKKVGRKTIGKHLVFSRELKKRGQVQSTRENTSTGSSNVVLHFAIMPSQGQSQAISIVFILLFPPSVSLSPSRLVI